MLKNVVIIFFLSFLSESSIGFQSMLAKGSKSDPSTKTGHFVFVTSTTSNANLGGIAGANTICQTRATAASLPGTWSAILHDNTGAASTRITITDNVYNLAGQLIAPSATVFWAGTNTKAPILFTELNVKSTAPYARVGDTSTLHCTNYTSSTGSDSVGVPKKYASSNMFGEASSGCGNGRPIYCISSVISLVPPAKAALPTMNHTFFITANTYTGSQIGGTAGGDAICQSEATTKGLTGTYVALLCSSTVDVSTRLTSILTGGVKYVDGSLIAIDSATMFSDIFKFINGSGTVWTGCSTGGAKTVNTCSDWTSTATNGDYGDPGQNSNGWFWKYFSGPAACTAAKKLYCISTSPNQPASY